MTEMREPVIFEAVRTPFAKAYGTFREVHPDGVLADTLDGLLELAGIDAEKIEDVVNGTVIRAGEQGANTGRLTLMLAGFPVTVPAVTYQGESAERIAEQGDAVLVEV
jgi:acetyl-CoA acetyltransferase